MGNKKTKYKKTYDLKATIIACIILLIIIVSLIYFILNAHEIYEYVVCVMLLSLIIFGIFGIISGMIQGKTYIWKEKRYIKNTNPYIYYRELPNNFGVGVTSLLIDSTIEDDKDIVAIILDLCARKYLNLVKQNDKYVVKILKEIDNELLSNEKYIFSLLKNNDIKNINYQEWYNYCMQDGIDLGLYYHKKIESKIEPPLNQNIIKKQRMVRLILSLVTSLVLLIFVLFNHNVSELFDHNIFLYIFFAILLVIIYPIICVIVYIVLIIPFYFISLFTAFKNIGKQSANINYKNMIEDNLWKTEKGLNEVQKLYSFKAFIRNFGHFVDKQPMEVILWDRYLSYAQVFGLTKYIMKSGYKEVIENASFQIDNIDNINLSNIEKI